ncbi:MspA family porin [Nocardia flavorosea]|uniref:Porin n=1 Tax=Nocardia flavorosea TaxID=53429 RepID=A0A846YGZ7_9NOCA|nr:MspA family porin [Nocardia flavorosea]NKY57000.1 porin [Nocardia flavorosea]
MGSKHTGRRARVAAAGLATAVALVLSAAPAGAVVDNADIVVDAQQRTITAIQADTMIRGLAPLDRNPLTRMWEHDGRAEFTVTGDKADEFKGTIKIGYLVGFPATFGGKIRVSYSTPSFGWNLGWGTPGLGFNGSLVPTVTGEIEVGFGPGVQQVELASGAITGASGHISLVNFVGTVTGVIGPATIQPYVTVIADSGDTVTTLGRPWDI